jgi:hypothetical protein
MDQRLRELVIIYILDANDPTAAAVRATLMKEGVYFKRRC